MRVVLVGEDLAAEREQAAALGEARILAGPEARAAVAAGALDALIAAGAASLPLVAEAARSRLDAPIVFLSSGDEAIERAALEAGASAILMRGWVREGFLADAIRQAALRRRIELGRNRAEEEIRDRERRFRAVFDGASDALLTVDDAGVYLDANPAASRLFALPREQIVGRRCGDFTVGGLQPGVWASFLATGHMSGAAEVLRADGERRFIDFAATAHILPGRHLTILRDRTVEHRTAEALGRSEAKFRALIEQMPAPMFVHQAGRIVYVNPAAARLVGREASSLIGTPALAQVHPDDQKRVGAQLASDEARTGEGRLVAADGQVLTVETQPMALSFEGERARVVIMRDVTRDRALEHALKESERSFRAVFEHAIVGLGIVDDQDRFVAANPAALRILGCASEQIVGTPAGRLFPGVGDAGQGPVEHVLERAGRPPLYVELTRARGHLPGRDLLVFQDVTERKLAEQKLLLADRLASVGTLAAGVAHEINNPLAYVMTNLGHLGDRLGELAELLPAGARGEIHEVLGETVDGAERIRRIVRDLRTFARDDEDRREAVDVRRVLDSSLALVRNELRHRAQLVREFEEVPPVEANEARLGQVFLNLLVNAAQAIEEGHVSDHRIELRTRVRDGRVIVQVADSGRGMEPEVQARIFDPFFTTKPVGAGSGLGLSICHGIVSGLGGDICVESAPGRGTTFTVSLPATQPRPRSSASLPRVSAGPRARVLVVDDEPSIGAAVRRVLSPQHHVVAVDSAREALARLSGGESFDVLLCDLMMPEMTGAELYAELERRAPAELPKVVFITGGAFTPTAQAFLAKVANPCLEKPFDTEKLRALVGTIAAARR